MFDVRVLIPFVILLDVLLLADMPRSVDLVAAGILAVLLCVYRSWSQVFWLVLAALVMVGGGALARVIGGPAAGLVGVSLAFLWRYVLAGCFGWFLLTHVSPTQFMASMTRWHFPRILLVPLAVVMRFFPTVVTEARAVGDSMRMRGLVGGRGGGVVLHPVRAAEYLVIPLLATSVRAGDELAASALSRGFGSAERRTTVTELRLRPVDALLFLVAGAVVVYAFGWIGHA